MVRENLRLETALGADEDGVVSGIGGRTRERQRRHQVAARATPCNQDLHRAAAPRLRPRATLTSTRTANGSSIGPVAAARSREVARPWPSSR